MEIVRDYYALHAIPELDRQLPLTLRYIKSRLPPSCRVFSPAPGALCAFLDLGQEKSLAFRADIDALPIEEQSQSPFPSRHPGKMHACGHDGHTAILLELARRLVAEKTARYNALLLFQPAEETDGGAQALCQAGVLAQWGVEAIFGLHLWPGLPAGRLFSREGALMGCSRGIQVEFTGKACHIAQLPHRDALDACCRFYSRASELKLEKKLLLGFGQLQAGRAANIVCDRACLSGTARALEQGVLDRLCRQLTGICKRSAYLTGCAGSITFSQGYPAIDNHAGLLRRARQLMPVGSLKQGYFTSDDFACYQRHAPGVYFLLGTGNTPALHTPGFFIDPILLSKGADLFETLCRQL